MGDWQEEHIGSTVFIAAADILLRKKTYTKLAYAATNRRQKDIDRKAVGDWQFFRQQNVI